MENKRMRELYQVWKMTRLDDDITEVAERGED